MNQHAPLIWPHKVTALILALGLIVMFGVSLQERILNPSLTMHNTPQAASAEDTGMSPLIGRLMQDVQKDPTNITKMLHLVEVLISESQWDAADTFIHRALAMAPENSQAHYLHGFILNHEGKHAEAAAALEKVITLDDSATVRYSLGILYIYYLKNVDEGIEHLQKGLDDPLAPEDLLEAIRKELAKVPVNKDTTTQ